MSRFHPTRQALNLMDASHSSASSLDPALSTLSPEDAEILEAIVSKSPEATTFMTVFKAYSEVLQQRGLDPGNDVVYYKQLLKLGVVKGINWGTKWNIVKNQLRLDLSTATTRIPQPGSRILPPQLSGLPPHDEDVFTLHSHADETETAVDNRHVTGLPFRRPLQLPNSSLADTMESFDNDSEVSRDIPPSSIPAAASKFVALRKRITPTSSISYNVLAEAPIRSSTPPLPRYRRNSSHSPTYNPRVHTGKGQEPLSRGINEAQAWKKVEQERHIGDADRFRRESLLSMCFETWKVGLDWTRSTHNQIVHARNHVQLRKFFERWRDRRARVKDVHDHASQFAQLSIQSAYFHLWRAKVHHKRVLGWRDEMRSRIARVKRKRDERIRDDAWTKWRQSYRSRQLYARNVLVRFFRRWREKLQRVARLEALADSFEDVRERSALENVMETWSRRVQLHDAEKYLTYKVARRTLASSFETWFRFAQDNHYADAYNATLLLKRAFSTWKKAKSNNHVLSHKGDKHLRRRDNLLLRAVVRVWIARERGQLLQRVKSTRLLKDAFVVWKQRREAQLQLQDNALAFAKQGSAVLLASIFNTWVQRCRSRNNVLALGDQHYTATLSSGTLLVWRLQLRARLRMARRAKMARKYFLEKQAWDMWRLAVAEKRRRRVLAQLEREKLKRMFLRWLEVARRNRHQAKATMVIQQLIHHNVLRGVLQHWTNRVVGLKLREIDMAEQYERDILATAFTKWKDMCHRHVENLSLVNSFQDVKREDTLRRMFTKWLAAARKSKTRRARLAEREQELRLEILGAAWETWRDRFCENMLRETEYRVIIQNQTNLLFRAFVIWKSRSKSVPGIRFHATNLKVKVWERWRAAMPLAMQARKAREMDAKNTLSAAFRRWTEAHRTKLALKAVARARYLRLPSPGQRASNPAPPEPPPLRPLLHRPLRSRTPGPPEHDDREAHTSAPAPPAGRRGRASLLAARPASRAETVDSSAARPAAALSSVGDDDRRERLWSELRGARLSGYGRAKSR